jgi:predicted transcriptional regulator
MTREQMQRATSEMVETLPAEPTWDDLMYSVYVRQKIDEGLADSLAGRVFSLEEVRAHFAPRK